MKRLQTRYSVKSASDTVCGGGLVTKLYLILVAPWTVASQTPLSMGFPKQDYRSGLTFPSPGDLPNPGIEPTAPALAGGLLSTEPPRKPLPATAFCPVAHCNIFFKQLLE